MRPWGAVVGFACSKPLQVLSPLFMGTVMGRGHYSGGSTIIYLSEAGTHFATPDIREASRPKQNPPRKVASADPASARKALLNCLLDENFRKRSGRTLPKKTPDWLKTEVGQAGGPDAWAANQSGYAKAKAKVDARAANKAPSTRAPSIIVPQSKLLRNYVRRRGATAKGKRPAEPNVAKATTKLRARPTKPPAPKLPTAQPVSLIGLGPDALDRLVAKGWTVVDTQVLPPRKSSVAHGKKSAKMQRKIAAEAMANVKAPNDVAERPRTVSRPQSSMIFERSQADNPAEWARSIKWSSDTDGDFG